MKNFYTIFLLVFIIGCKKSSTDTDTFPLAPSDLGSLGVSYPLSTTQVHLSWTDKSTNEIGFKIQRKIVGGNFADIGSTAKDVTEFTDNGLNPNTSYVYRVFSYNNIGNSITYSNELSVQTSPVSAVDIDGNSYPIITIGNQNWTTKNLNVSKYSDGTTIPQVTDPTGWQNLKTGAWCYYQHNTSNGVVYGKIYNWYAVAGIYNDASYLNRSLRKQIAPAGYHVPSDTEWSSFVTYLGGENLAAGSLKQSGLTHWITPNTGATNSSGFDGLPGGKYYEAQSGIAFFAGLGSLGGWWSSTAPNTPPVRAYSWSISYNSIVITRTSTPCETGYSVRLIMD